MAHEVYVRILRLPGSAAIRDPGTYLYTVTSNLARDHARQERHGVALDVDDPTARTRVTHRNTPIEITTPALRNLQVSGVSATDNIAAFIAFLRSLERVHLEVTATRIRVSNDQG